MSYVYPFGSHATVERIDQGQDFGGTGPILAIGKAQIVKLGAPGWPGGQGILYRLLDGPRRGQYVFVYEGVRPAVRAGQVVEAGQKIGSLIPGSSTGIEIGFADASGVPLSHSEYTEGKETVHGKEMARFLAALKSGAGSGGGFSLGGALETAGEVGATVLSPVGGLLSGAAGDLFNKGTDAAKEAASSVGGEVVDYIGQLLGEKAAPILLNVGLVLGGAFLIYFGAARTFGVAQPLRTPLRAVRGGGLAAAGAAA